MHLYGKRVFEPQENDGARGKSAGIRLRAIAAVMLTMTAGVPQGFAQQAGNTQTPKEQSSGLPAAPQPIATEPFSLRQSQHDFTRPQGDIVGRPWKMYSPTTVA